MYGSAIVRQLVAMPNHGFGVPGHRAVIPGRSAVIPCLTSNQRAPGIPVVRTDPRYFRPAEVAPPAGRPHQS